MADLSNNRQGHNELYIHASISQSQTLVLRSLTVASLSDDPSRCAGGYRLAAAP